MVDGARASQHAGSVPLEHVRVLLHQVHDGPAQAAATVRVALAVRRQAVRQGDESAIALAESTLDQAVQELLTDITSVQETLRGWLDTSNTRTTFAPPEEARRR